MDKFKLPERFKQSRRDVWLEYDELIEMYSPLNLGQGFPNFGPSQAVKDSFKAIVSDGNHLIHQYTRGYGHPRLVQSLAKLYTKLLNRTVDAQREVFISYGAQHAMFCVIQGHVNPGDEVILVEPFFDAYEPMIQMVGGVLRYIPLKFTPDPNAETHTSAEWTLDFDALEEMFNDKTKMIVINTPHNPSGKVYDYKELERISNLCKKFNVLCLSDEVYEFLVYDPCVHTRICTLPGMWERTITIGSAGKSFGITGWRIGWAFGDSKILRNAMVVHQNCVYTVSTPIQEALAVVLEKEVARFDDDDCYFKIFSKEMKVKRDRMVEILKNAGMIPIIPDGGYFVLANFSPLEGKVDLSKETDKLKDYRFTKWMIRNAGILGIPLSAFYTEGNKNINESFVRYCFVKTEQVLDRAENLLLAWLKRKKKV